MDRYTKAVLTVIAIALFVLAVQNAMPLRTATALGFEDCGSRFNPCTVNLNLKLSGGAMLSLL